MDEESASHRRHVGPPYAKGPEAGNHWIATGSHVMVVGPAVKAMPGYPKDAEAILKEATDIQRHLLAQDALMATMLERAGHRDPAQPSEQPR